MESSVSKVKGAYGRVLTKQFYALTASAHSVRQFGVDEALKSRENHRKCRFQSFFPYFRADF